VIEPLRISQRLACPAEHSFVGTADGTGTQQDPWVLTTPSGGAEYTAWGEEGAEPPALVVQVGTTQLRDHLRAIDDLREMLAAAGDSVPLGSADEGKPARCSSGSASPRWSTTRGTTGCAA
jgi:hypothetical protein